jgi:hypothetical protein
MKKFTIALIFLLIVFIAVFFSSNFSDTDKDSGKKSLSEVKCDTQTVVKKESTSEMLQRLGICLNVDEKTWQKNIESNQSKWRYFYDTTYFKIHLLSKNSSIDELLLLEAQINHGSGEYDNYIIKNVDGKYQIITEFKGYLDSIVQGHPDFRMYYSFNISPNKSCKVIGHFNGQSVITDTVLTKHKYCKDIVKGQKWE